MTADELRSWLQQSSSTSAGWSKESDGGGETVGHDSGRNIVAILERNPDKNPDVYDDEDIQHMRKVVSYCKRHLAQEGKAKQDPDSRSARLVEKLSFFLFFLTFNQVIMLCSCVLIMDCSQVFEELGT